jgi:hypothetical protein
VQQQLRVKSLRVQGRVFFCLIRMISYFHAFQSRKWVVTYVCIERGLLLMCFPPLLLLFSSDSAPTRVHFGVVEEQ